MTDIKVAILNRVIEVVRDQLKNAEQGRLGAAMEAVSHKGAMASRYDTFKEEAQYLAGGYAAQAAKLNRILSALKSLLESPPTVVHGSLYSIVELRGLANGARVKFFLLPAGGGEIHEVKGEKITVLTIGSPLALALIGKVPGNLVELEIDGVTEDFQVVSLV